MQCPIEVGDTKSTQISITETNSVLAQETTTMVVEDKQPYETASEFG